MIATVTTYNLPREKSPQLKNMYARTIAYALFTKIYILIPNYLKDPENFKEAKPLTKESHSD